MSIAIDKITEAYQWATTNRPVVNGFPYLAEVLRRAGVSRYILSLPSCQSIFYSENGNIVSQTEVLVKGMADVPRFNRDEFINLLRTHQAGESTFPEFLQGSWEAGITRYEADLISRTVTYYGVENESYVEDYPAIEIVY